MLSTREFEDRRMNRGDSHTVDHEQRSNMMFRSILDRTLGEVLSLLDNETGMHSCLESKPRSPGDTGGKRRHPRAYENTGIGADEPEA